MSVVRGGPKTVERIRSAMWVSGLPVRTALVLAIKAYRLLLSGWLGGQCRFYPSCSAYAEQAVRERGAIVGTALAVWRVARCGPFTRGGVDRVPRRPTRGPGPEIIAPQGEARLTG